MGVQVSHNIHPEIQKKNYIQSAAKKDIREIIRDLCKWKEVEIIERNMMPDHVHIFPNMSISSFMGYLKGKVQ